MPEIAEDHRLLKSLIESADIASLRDLLNKRPELANEGLPYDEENLTKAPPLHRLCDAVFNKKITDEQAVELAKVFLEAGADVNAVPARKNADSPLVAAASLHADQVAILYLENGAHIQHQGCHGGTALHWASWCGRDVLVDKLLEQGAEMNKLCDEFKSTPLFWAVHGLRFGNFNNPEHHIECVRLLLKAGADKSIPNFEGYKPIDVVEGKYAELKELLSEA